MPSAYAHYRLGQEVFNELPRDIRDLISPYKELFDIGLHGPDVLFYHDPLLPGGVSRIGYATHHKSGEEVFKDAGKVVKLHDGAAIYLAYLYGYLCHFALDCMCHGYVTLRINESGICHNEIETQFDRMLMVQDGLDPLSHCTTAHIVPSMRNSAVISAFFDGTRPKDVQRSLRSMITCIKLLRAEEPSKRKLIYAAFHATGKFKELSGLVMSTAPNPQCEVSNRRLLELYKLAVPLAKKLITEFEKTMEGKLPFDPHYRFNFESENMKEVRADELQADET
ncbi:MAG: zinc dependent phospholipase C family protein [Oscillospiraceae bacterium]